MESATIMTPMPNDANHPMRPSPWSFLFNDTSPGSDGKLNFRAIFCVIIGLVSIGCEGTIISKVGTGITPSSNLFGSYLTALGLFIVLLYHHKVVVLASAFILSFYELINLIQVIVTCSLIIAKWDTGYGGITLTDSDSSVVRALVITCLVCACLGLLFTFSFMIIISDEFRLQGRYILMQQQPISTVTYTNPAATIFTS